MTPLILLGLSLLTGVVFSLFIIWKGRPRPLPKTTSAWESLYKAQKELHEWEMQNRQQRLVGICAESRQPNLSEKVARRNSPRNILVLSHDGLTLTQEKWFDRKNRRRFQPFRPL